MHSNCMGVQFDCTISTSGPQLAREDVNESSMEEVNNKGRRRERE
jgi:hypothetical protein